MSSLVKMSTIKAIDNETKSETFQKQIADVIFNEAQEEEKMLSKLTMLGINITEKAISRDIMIEELQKVESSTIRDKWITYLRILQDTDLKIVDDITRTAYETQNNIREKCSYTETIKKM